MDTHKSIIKRTPSIVVTGILPLCATFMSSPVLAVDAIGGNANNGFTVVNTGGCQWTVLETVPFQNPTPRFCIATGSADAINPTTFAGSERVYHFTVSNTPAPICNQGQERTLTFWNQGEIRDNSVKEITTTGGWMAPDPFDPGYFTVPAGNRTLYFLARKATPATPNLTVDDASLAVTCTDRQLVPPFGFVPD